MVRSGANGIVLEPRTGGFSAVPPQDGTVLLDQLFGGRHHRLGDAVLAAQSAYADTGSFDELLSIYHLLGDPALELR